jgi:hypothetical protein
MASFALLFLTFPHSLYPTTFLLHRFFNNNTFLDLAQQTSTMGYIPRDRFASMPRTTFYITTIFELRGESDKYVYSIE